MNLSTRSVALIAVFAALQALLSIFPFAITIGVSGEITLGVIGGPLIGIILGPALGGLATLIGSFIGTFVNPGGALLGILTPLPSFFGAVGAGCVKTKKGYVAGIIMLVAILLFYAHPYGREAWMYTWLHIVAMVIAFSPIAFMAGSVFDSSSTARPIFGIIIAAFIGVLADHIVGSAIAMWYFSGLAPQIWLGIMFVYPIERIVAMILITVIATPVYYSLRRAGFIDSIKQQGKTK